MAEPLTPSAPLRTISYGGGVQSTALVVLAAQGVIDFPVALFANVGDRAENPATLTYMAEHAMPYAAAHGIEVHQLRWVSRGGVVRDLYDDVMGDNRTIPIPVKMLGGAPGRRQCTDRYKIAVVSRWCRAHGATPDTPATVAVGISTDEFDRASTRRPSPHEVVTYPLLELGLSRNDCARIIRDAGLPVPPKSSCWFCPFQSTRSWAEKRRDAPDVFAAGVVMERRLNEKRASMGKDAVYIAKAGVALEDTPEADPSLFDGPEGCDSGSCWT